MTCKSLDFPYSSKDAKKPSNRFVIKTEMLFILSILGVLNIDRDSNQDTSFYYIQINEIQKNIDEITCIFPKVIFSLGKISKVLFHYSENNNFWMTSAFFLSFLLTPLSHFRNSDTRSSLFANKNVQCGYIFS